MIRVKTFACLLLTTFVLLLSTFYISEKSLVLNNGNDKSIQESWIYKLFGLTVANPDTKAEDAENLDEEMAKRRWSIDRICHHLRLYKNRQEVEAKELNHIIVDDKYRLLYCSVAKVASTNWRRIFMVLKGNVSQNLLDIPAKESHRADLFRTLDNYSASEVEYRLRHYLKFLFVRHPFERLLSAYRNKFEKPNAYFHERFGRLIVQRFRPNATAEALAKGENVTFDEFVQYLLDPQTAAEGPFNEHWRPVNRLCHPCAVRYDVVGKYEGLDGEAGYVLQRAGIAPLVSFPKITRTVDTSDLLDEYFGNLTKSSIFRLYQTYALDFKMFGYKLPDFEKYPND